MTSYAPQLWNDLFVKGNCAVFGWLWRAINLHGLNNFQLSGYGIYGPLLLANNHVVVRRNAHFRRFPHILSASLGGIVNFNGH